MSTNIIKKALAVVLAAGALTTLAATGPASAGFGGWHRGYDHDRRFGYDREYRFDYDRDFYRWNYRHDYGFRRFHFH
jgi:hypothetical protein